MPQVFLSHAPSGLDPAFYLKRALENQSITAFLSSEDIAPFSEWEAAIEQNLKEMRVFVPVWTGDYEASLWAMMEATYAWFNRDSVLIAPVMLGESPPNHPTNRFQACTVQHVPGLPPFPLPPADYGGFMWSDQHWQQWADEVANLIVQRAAEWRNALP